MLACGLTGEAEDSLGPGVEGDADDEQDDQDQHDHADDRAGTEGLCKWERGQLRLNTLISLFWLLELFTLRLRPRIWLPLKIELVMIFKAS